MSTYTISAADVKKLRDQTGAGMMDCKKALTEAEGDFEKAVEVLRLKGQKLSLKRADRDAKEGAVIAIVNDSADKGVVIRLSCETDFVAKNEDFVKFANQIATMALNNFPTDTEALLALPYEGITLGEKVTEQVGAIGEKIEVAEYERLEAPMITSYIHSGNRAGVLVGLNKANADFDAPGKDVAMQIAAMKPVAVDENGVSSEIIEKEIELGKEMARQEGKPEQMIEKIAQGKLKKFMKENTLLPQAFVKDNKKSVAEYLKSFDSELTVTDFKHVKLG
jgi:elongation factor Ts